MTPDRIATCAMFLFFGAFYLAVRILDSFDRKDAEEIQGQPWND